MRISNKYLEPVFISRNAGWARGFFARRRQFDAGVLDVRQGEWTKYGGKRPAQAALSACEYRFLCFLFLACLLSTLCSCTDAPAESPPPAQTDGPGVTVAASFRQEDGTALSGSTIRISSEEKNEERTLDADGEARISGLARDGSIALTVLDSQEQSRGAMSLTFTEGAVIDAATDESGNGHVILRKDTAEIALEFLLKGDGTLQCALRLEETSPSGTSQGRS